MLDLDRQRPAPRLSDSSLAATDSAILQLAIHVYWGTTPRTSGVGERTKNVVRGSRTSKQRRRCGVDGASCTHGYDKWR